MNTKNNNLFVEKNKCIQTKVKIICKTFFLMHNGLDKK